MWYFTPKSDLAFLEKFKMTTTEFIAARSAAKSIVPSGARRAVRSETDQHAPGIEKRDKLRTTFSQQQSRAAWIARRYKVQVVFSVWIHTIALERAQIDAYSAVTENTASPEEVEQRAIDTIDRCIGACKDQMREDFLHLINPLYWIYTCFHSLFTLSGLGKPLGESVTKLLSKIFTALCVAATPWLKHLAELWFKRLTS